MVLPRLLSVVAAAAAVRPLQRENLQDRILRRFAGAIAATLRTNYFQPDHHGPFKSYVSFKLDSRPPKLPVSEFMSREARFAMLRRARPDEAAELGALAQHDVDERWHVYEQLAEIEHEPADPEAAEDETT